MSWVGFHGDALRSGWNPRETALTPDTVASDRFGKRWDSPPFDAFKGVPGRAYASPLYLEDVKLTGGTFDGRVADVVFVGTSNADVYAVSAVLVRDIPAGTVLWKRHLGDPGHAIDGLRIGVLGTPVVDVNAQPARLYVAADVQAPAAEGGAAWRVFALDLGNGNVLPGWPVLLDASTVGPVNQNGPATFLDVRESIAAWGAGHQPRRPSALRPVRRVLRWERRLAGGDRHGDPAGGQLVLLRTRARGKGERRDLGLGRAAVDTDGSVFAVTGNSPPVNLERTWGESVLRWAPGVPLQLTGTYTAWNHCQLDNGDIDLSGSGVTLLPEVRGTSTPRLAVVGGKQGNVYLLDRDHLPGGLDTRPDCNWKSPIDSPPDGSLWDPAAPRPYYRGGSPGPLNVFGPYSEDDGWAMKAKARSTPAVFQAENGTTYVVVTGSTKDPLDLVTPRPPSVARLRVVTPSPSRPAHSSSSRPTSRRSSSRVPARR